MGQDFEGWGAAPGGAGDGPTTTGQPGISARGQRRLSRRHAAALAVTGGLAGLVIGAGGAALAANGGSGSSSAEPSGPTGSQVVEGYGSLPDAPDQGTEGYGPAAGSPGGGSADCPGMAPGSSGSGSGGTGSGGGTTDGTATSSGTTV